MSEREQLEQSIAALEAQRPILGDAVVDPAIAALREKLAALEAPAAAEQRKQVTILFADVSGFTAMSETMDAEEVRDTMNDLWERLDGAIIAQGGLIDKHMGDGVMALFGAPVAREDDPRRAIRAALAMQKEIAEFRIRIGINTGPVLLGEVGTTDEYTAMGDAVNLASRLEHAAPVGGILISHDTYRHVRGVFDVQPLEPIRVKGKAEPIRVYVVEGARPRAFRVTTRGIEGIETRMIGRDAELHHLQEALYGVIEDGEAQAVTIVGEAGVGKSRLLYEFRKWLDLQPGVAWSFKGRANQEMSNLPYALIRDLFAFHFEIQASDPAAVAREKLEQGIVALLGTGAEDTEAVEKAHFIGQLIGFDFSASPHLRGVVSDAQQVHDRAFHYTVQLFAGMAGDGPVAIYLEDAHWADDGSLDLIDHLARECRDAPLLIVTLARPTFFERRPLWGEGRAAYTRLELRPLSKRNSRRLVKEILQKVEEVPPDLRDLIVNGAEGNPFYVEELIRMLIEGGVIVKGADRWRVEMERLAEVRVPSALTGVVQARLDGLPPFERETLQRASVVGRIFWDGAVERIGESANRRVSESANGRVSESANRRIGESAGERQEESETSAALAALRGRELIFEREVSAFAGEREYIFKHAILHDVTYESVLKRLRRVYHAQVAAWLIERSGERVGEYAGRVGEHYERAGEKTRAAEWYGQAGEQAQETYALETALDYYQKALALEARLGWLRGKVEVLHWLGRREEETETLQVLADTPGVSAAEADYLWARYHEAVSDYEAAKVAGERARRAYQPAGDQDGEARCLVLLGLATRKQGDYPQAQAWYEEALALLDEATRPREAALALNGLGMVYMNLGDYAEARECHEGALKLQRTHEDRLGEANSLSYLGLISRDLGDLTNSLAYHRQALALRQAIGDRWGEGGSLHNLGLYNYDLGDYAQAEDYYQQALVVHRSIGDRWGEANTLNSYGILCQDLGDLTKARSLLEQALELSRSISDHEGEAGMLLNLGAISRDLGDSTQAENYLESTLALARKLSHRLLEGYALSYMGLLHLTLGAAQAARDCALAALAIRRELEQRPLQADDLALLAMALMELGERDTALRRAHEALAILAECEAEGPDAPQRDYFYCYRVLAAIGHPEEARRALQSAYELVMARAEKIIAPALRQSFLENMPQNREIIAAWQVMQAAQ